ncbi:MAG: hypothetical protein WDM87_06650 [Terracidiphilus sp.]
MNSVEERGGNGEESVARPAIGERADVCVDAEDFLKNDEAGDWLGRGMGGGIGAERVAVGGRKVYDSFIVERPQSPPSIYSAKTGAQAGGVGFEPSHSSPDLQDAGPSTPTVRRGGRWSLRMTARLRQQAVVAREEVL